MDQDLSQTPYLYEYIKNNSKLDKKILDSLKYEIDQHIYYYGDQFKFPKEKKTIVNEQILTKQKKYLSQIKNLIKSFLYKNKSIANDKIKINPNNTNIIANTYFNFNLELEKLDYKVYKPVWSDINYHLEDDLLVLLSEIKEMFSLGFFNQIVNAQFIEDIKEFYELLKQFYKNRNIKALFFPYDMPFFENLSIKLFKEIGKPTFVVNHGLPARYNNIDDSRGDYLLVWGEKVKENYINAGVDKNKILITGHPTYKNITAKELKFDFSNILVLTKDMYGAQLYSNMYRISDRGVLILYLYSIENVLKKIGVKNVRLRPHPSENGEWFMKYINNEFYTLDIDNLETSLNKSTLVIGSITSVILESVFFGINYLVYEPCYKGQDLVNYPLAPPFDNSDPKIPVAKNEEELLYILKNQIKIDVSFINDYIKTPFDISSLKKMI